MKTTKSLLAAAVRALRYKLVLILPVLLSVFAVLDAQAAEDDILIQSLASELGSKKKAVRVKAIETIAESSAGKKEEWLQAILDGKLYLRKSDKKTVVASKNGKLYDIIDAVDGQSLGTVKKNTLSKIKIDNSIRIKIRSLLGTMVLQNPEPSKRLAAVTELVGTSDQGIVSRIRDLSIEESDPEVGKAMQLLLSVHDLERGTPEQQMKALEFADGNLNNDIVNALGRLVETSALQESGEEIESLAKDLVSKAERARAWYAKIETLFFGLSLGSVLVVAAIGLAITFGVMGVINMAHGELIMLGAYTTYFIQQLFPESINYSLLLAVPAAFLVSGLVGIAIERSVIRHLYGRPLETLLATFGISLMLQQFVRTFVSTQNVAVINPVWMSGSWIVNPALSLTLNRLVIILFCLAVFTVLLLIFTRTGFGLQMRAVAQNRQMARAMGIRSARVDALTFGLGSGVAGIAGVALSQLGNVGPNLGQSYIIDSFMVVVFGGVGNLWGTLVAGMSLGIANKIVEPWAGAVMAKILILVFIIIFIQRKPRGLFPQRGRAAEG